MPAKDPKTGKFMASSTAATTDGNEQAAPAELTAGDVVTFERKDPIFGNTYVGRGVVELVDDAGVHVRPLEAYAVLVETAQVV